MARCITLRRNYENTGRVKSAWRFFLASVTFWTPPLFETVKNNKIVYKVINQRNYSFAQQR